MDFPVVESYGKYNLRYGYNSSMDLSNVLATLESSGTSAVDVGSVISDMAKAGVPGEKLANYLSDYYKLFGW